MRTFRIRILNSHPQLKELQSVQTQAFWQAGAVPVCTNTLTRTICRRKPAQSIDAPCSQAGTADRKRRTTAAETAVETAVETAAVVLPGGTIGPDGGDKYRKKDKEKWKRHRKKKYLRIIL